MSSGRGTLKEDLWSPSSTLEQLVRSCWEGQFIIHTVWGTALYVTKRKRYEVVPGSVPMLSCVEGAPSFVQHKGTVTLQQEGDYIRLHNH